MSDYVEFEEAFEEEQERIVEVEVIRLSIREEEISYRAGNFPSYYKKLLKKPDGEVTHQVARIRITGMSDCGYEGEVVFSNVEGLAKMAVGIKRGIWDIGGVEFMEYEKFKKALRGSIDIATIKTIGRLFKG